MMEYNVTNIEFIGISSYDPNIVIKSENVEENYSPESNHNIINGTDYESSGANDNPYACDICHKEFSRIRSLKRHKLTHTDREVYPCDKCKRTFFDPNRLKVHIRTLHNETYKCKKCSKTFPDTSQLNAHYLTHSTDDKPYSCDECGRSFQRSLYLRKHKTIHSGIRPHQCDICEKRFREASKLRIHRNIHTGDVRYQCNFCDKSYNQPSSLRAHRKIHTGQKNFNCDVCWKSFWEPRRLREHYKVHLKDGTAKNLQLAQNKPDEFESYSVIPVVAAEQVEEAQTTELNVVSENTENDYEVNGAVNSILLQPETHLETVYIKLEDSGVGFYTYQQSSL